MRQMNSLDIPYRFMPLTPLILLSSHLRPCIPKGIFPSDIPVTILNYFLFPLCEYMPCQSYAPRYGNSNKETGVYLKSTAFSVVRLRISEHFRWFGVIYGCHLQDRIESKAKTRKKYVKFSKLHRFNTDNRTLQNNHCENLKSSDCLFGHVSHYIFVSLHGTRNKEILNIILSYLYVSRM
jgi:hypothetical protein